ncbi:unnamed protein product [Plutella xylostella]|uniref:(diamondback moth) hypothetical protein n=1 Tax=Plutella xylostella TaxID=51655 RepID=A0A8S4GCM1_PLUXY|nr:unnamed protein product [Plutella xylostella]
MPKRSHAERLERAKRKVRRLEEKYKSDNGDKDVPATQLHTPPLVMETQPAIPTQHHVLSPGDWFNGTEDYNSYYGQSVEYDNTLWDNNTQIYGEASVSVHESVHQTESVPNPIPAPGTPVATTSEQNVGQAQMPETQLPPDVPTTIVPTSHDLEQTTTNTDRPDTNILPVNEPIALDEDLLNILGDDPTTSVVYGPEIRPELETRFRHIVTNGLNKEQRKEIIAKYPLPINCQIIGAPQVNPEMKTPIPSTVANRDKGIELKQKQMASAISCLGEIITTMLSTKDRDNQLLQKSMDAARLLCDLQHGNSVTRRNFILFSLKQDKKEHLSNTKIDTFLFGEDLGKTLVAANAVNKSAAELRAPQKKPNSYLVPNSNHKSLNRRAPPVRRPPATRAPVAGARNYESAGWPRQQPFPPPPPPPPQHAHSSRSSRPRPPPPPPPPHQRGRRWY